MTGDCRGGAAAVAFTIGATLLLIGVPVAAVAPARQRIAPPDGTRPELYAALDSGEMPSTETLRALDDTTRRDFERRVALRAAYVPTLPRRRRGEMAAVDDKKRSVEAYLVACAGRRGEVAPMAARYASTAVLAYEWEGYSEGPLAEAEHAEAYLRRYPRSVLRGGLELFLLVRYRAAFEAATFSGQHEAQQRAAEGYRTVWTRVRASRDPVIVAVGRDIDAAQQVYMRSDSHPRTFGR